jgi:CHAT domain-containing protein
MTKGPGPGNLVRLSNVQTTLQSNHFGEKRLWHSHRNLLPVVVAIFVLTTSSVFAQSAPTATGRKLPREELVRPGVVVEKVEKGSAAEEAGLQKGDLILSWGRGNDLEEIRSPFDWSAALTTQSVFQDVSLHGVRDTAFHSWDLQSTLKSGMSVRPNFSGRLLRGYERCERLKDRMPVSSIACFQAFAEQLIAQREKITAAWLLVHEAEFQQRKKQWRDADQIYDRVLNDLEGLGAGPVINILLKRGSFLLRKGENVKAAKYLEQALQLSRGFGNDNVVTLGTLGSLISFYWSNGDMAKADEFSSEYLVIIERMYPGSDLLARTLTTAGSICLHRADLISADQFYKKALVIEGKKETSLKGAILLYEAIIAWRRGDLSLAEQYCTQSYRILIEKATESQELASCLGQLGTLARDRGNLTFAEDYERKSLALFQKKGLYLRTGDVFNDLAYLALYRGEAFEAQDFFKRALLIQEQYLPGGAGVANSLMGLGMALARQKKFALAEESLKRSLAIQKKLAPTALDVPRSLAVLGDIARDKGNLEKAENLYRNAFHLLESCAPESVFMVQTLSRLAKVTALRGAMTESENLYLQALTMIEKLAPESTQAAEVLESLADLKREQGQVDAAISYYERALQATESQTAMLGGSADVVAGFRAQHQEFYGRYADLLAQGGQTEAAFAVVERSRARTLFETLARGEVDVSKGADPALLKKEKSLQGDLRGKSERRIHLLGEKHTDEQINEIEKQISDLSSEYQEVESQIRASSPAYAALTQPQPLTAKEIQTQLLDQNTLLLEYSLGEDRSHVFAVTPDSLEAFELPRRAEIEKEARLVYQLLTARNHPVKGESEAQKDKRWAESAKAYDAASVELSRMVLAPVAAQMKNKRLVIVADGALHYVPFAALPEPEALAMLPQPLAVNHEIVSLPSASVLGLLRQQYKDRKPAPNAVAVLADPVFEKNDSRVSASLPHDTDSIARVSQVTKKPREKQIAATAGPKKRAAGKATSGDDIDALLSVPLSASLLTRSASDLGFDRNGKLSLPRLRYTRDEADAIYAVTPATKGLEATDFRANRATAISPDLASYRIVHFATHGLLNSQHPELSGLVFSLVDKNGNAQDGFLTLQDIYNLNLPADLVVLSACETGLGKEISGEGLIGLTRGFMYAGASRVVASLWNVSDIATAHLMAEFYRSMEKDGLPPAAALRAAQVKMLQQKRWASPYYWAAFQLQGEWK